MKLSSLFVQLIDCGVLSVPWLHLRNNLSLQAYNHLNAHLKHYNFALNRMIWEFRLVINFLLLFFTYQLWAVRISKCFLWRFERLIDRRLFLGSFWRRFRVVLLVDNNNLTTVGCSHNSVLFDNLLIDFVIESSKVLGSLLLNLMTCELFGGQWCCTFWVIAFYDNHFIWKGTYLMFTYCAFYSEFHNLVVKQLAACRLGPKLVGLSR